MSSPVPLAILQCGMRTPVGLSARETAASARSRTARITAIDIRDRRFERFTVGALPEDCLPPLQPQLEAQSLTYRESRMLRIGAEALKEAFESLPPGLGNIPLIVGLPELHTTKPIEGPGFLSRLAVQSGLDIDLGQSVAITKGRASALLAVQKASEILQQGKAKIVVVGGIDTQVDLFILATLDSQGRVRNDSNPDGFAPGEGAGFLVLTTSQHAGRLRMVPLATILGSAAGVEQGHLYSQEPYKGEGLANTFAKLFETLPDVPKVGCVYVSFNGEHYWAKEFGVAMLRHAEHVGDHVVEHPAECFGDLGAAHGAVLLGLAALRVKRTCPATSTLVSASSDFGDRAVVLLAAS